MYTSEDSDQPGHPPSLISLSCPHEEILFLSCSLRSESSHNAASDQGLHCLLRGISITNRTKMKKKKQKKKKKPFLVRLSLLTMTNPNQLCDVLLFVCSKMADETNLSSKLPVADRTREV